MSSREEGKGRGTRHIGNGWIDTSLVMGEKPYRLLKGVATLGSLNKAAKEMNIHYHTARCVLSRFEQALGLTLMERKIGGASGGGSWLTGPGQRFVGQYEQFRTEALRTLHELYRKHFTT